MRTDADLLRAYAEENSEEAFGELVRRHVNLVYSIALRQCGGDAHLAEDVAQRVLTDLARKARSLSGYTVLGGWLYRRAQFVASDIVRADHRRRAREQKAQAMQDVSRPTASDAEWKILAPVLDQAIGELPERDRNAVVLRFVEARPFREIGATLRLTEDAARRRVERALEKLRSALARRGITSTSAALGVALANQAAAVPARVTASLTAAALAGAGSGTGATGLALLTMSKIKIGVMGAVLLTGVAMVVIDAHANRGLRAELRTLRADEVDFGAQSKEKQRLNEALRKLSADNPEAGELAHLRQRAAVLQARPPGVLDAEMISAANWHNVGRATPEAANMTFHWAMFTRDLETVAKFVSFDDDTPENRAAFMGHFSPAARAKYGTPERIMAAAAYGAGENVAQPPDDAFQFLGTDDHVGGNGSRFGQKHVRVWYRMASGKEFEGSTRWQLTPDGWLPAAFTLRKEWETAVADFDGASGNRLPSRPPAKSAPAKN